jgi:folate-dependent phosphoribosylglycinamide formyltransferase PurN
METKKWLALFSQTGKEIGDISAKVGRFPDLILTDNVQINANVDQRIVSNCPIIWRKYRGLSKEEKIHYYEEYFNDYDIITLHGWLNIVPPQICEQFKIYNGHPGLITQYPELKGKDPQEKAWNNILFYPYVGSVVHRVTAKVDDGEIIAESLLHRSHCTSLEDTFSTLRITSLRAWLDFFQTHL